jgi:ATP-dependent Lon protease
MSSFAVPSSPIAILPLRNGVLFPGSVLAFSVGRARSLALARRLHPGDVLVTLTQRDPRTADPAQSDLFVQGTLAVVRELERKNDDEYQLVLEGLSRVTLTQLYASGMVLEGHVIALPDQLSQDSENVALSTALRSAVEELGGARGLVLARQIQGERDPVRLADRVAASLELDVDHATAILGEASVSTRLKLVLAALHARRTHEEVQTKIERDVREELGKHQREVVLREQLRAIKRELGDGDGDSDLEQLKQRLDAAQLPEAAQKIADREFRRLEAGSNLGAEANVVRSYLELLADLPWNARAETLTDLGAMEAKLDADHHGLADIKLRLLEYMAVQNLRRTNPTTQQGGGTLLCLVGPPGVGKTSLAQSVADATQRPFVRVALGGVRDEAEIRGHRRTYVGALPGRILTALKKSKVKNPVILLDEIDKLGHSWAGSPEAALLEVLDPEQNRHFTDHYLEIPFDLSEVIFVCTANTLDTLSGPLRDRLEIVEVHGYTDDEKLHIARKHLVPKQMREHGLAGVTLELADAELRSVIRDYTREAGVRQLDRLIGKVMRGLALDWAKRIANQPDTISEPLQVDAARLRNRLGKPLFEEELAERTAVPGVATGLAWSPVGGSILFIETSTMPGKGAVEITGQLGDVMKESARAALTFVRSHAGELGIPTAALQGQDVHIHVPAGGIPKDGPSAGVTIFTALASLFTGRRVLPNIAMTGECTLRGKVLPVGGIKEKVLAAHRAGIQTVILPKRNERDLAELPASVREGMAFIPVSDMFDVLAAALEPSLQALTQLAPTATYTLSR